MNVELLYPAEERKNPSLVILTRDLWIERHALYHYTTITTKELFFVKYHFRQKKPKFARDSRISPSAQKERKVK